MVILQQFYVSSPKLVSGKGSQRSTQCSEHKCYSQIETAVETIDLLDTDSENTLTELINSPQIVESAIDAPGNGKLNHFA